MVPSYMNHKNYKLENFLKARAQLEEYLAIPVLNKRDQSGIIQAFEFTFETLIKYLQSRSKDKGIETPFPRDALENSIKLGIFDVEDEEHLVSMLHDRNLTSHVYQEQLAQEIFNRITVNYCILFRKVIPEHR